MAVAYTAEKGMAAVSCVQMERMACMLAVWAVCPALLVNTPPRLAALDA